MRVGLHALGIGVGARPEVIRAVATAAETAGFATLWAGEHVVLVDQPTSRYPYSADGRIAVPAHADWLDPLLGLSFAAAVTDTIGLATGVLLLPEHNPVVAAKQAATLDVLSAGRLTLGVGIGWSAEEFAALGVPFARRAQRTAEYVAAMRTLWADDPASFAGEFTRFDSVRVNPKPVRNSRIPIVLGGNSDASLTRRHPRRPTPPCRDRRDRARRGGSTAARPVRRHRLGPRSGSPVARHPRPTRLGNHRRVVFRAVSLDRRRGQ
jgi:probable F420-dependent oxidoreductase